MRITVLGLGKIGAWLARELAVEHQVAGFDTDSSIEIQGITRLGSLEEIQSFKPELFINAVCLQNTINAFQTATPFLPKECVIGDVASIKTGLVEYYEQTGSEFFSIHPMFGPTNANLQSLKGENAVIASEGNASARQFFKSFFEQRGIRVFECSIQEHDKMMAYSLTTPFVSSLVFAACMEQGIVPGTTFAKHLDIASRLLSEDDALIYQVLFNPNSLKQLDKITSRLEFLKHVIKANDSEEAKRFLAGLRKNINTGRKEG